MVRASAQGSPTTALPSLAKPKQFKTALLVSMMTSPTVSHVMTLQMRQQTTSAAMEHVREFQLFALEAHASEQAHQTVSPATMNISMQVRHVSMETQRQEMTFVMGLETARVHLSIVPSQAPVLKLSFQMALDVQPPSTRRAPHVMMVMHLL